MAEQFESVHNQGPNIDIQLYPDAVLKGAEAGQAIGTPFGAAAKGVTEGINSYIKDTQGFQQIAAQKAENAVNTDPNVIAARKSEIESKSSLEASQADIAKMQDDLAKQNETLNDKTQTAELQQKLNEATQANGDFDNLQKITALPNGTPDDINAALADPNIQSTLSRHPDQAIQVLTSLSGRKDIDQGVIQNQYARYTAIANQKIQIQLAENRVKLAQANAAKNQEKWNAGASAAYSLFGDATLNATDTSNFKLLPKNKYNVQPDPDHPGQYVLEANPDGTLVQKKDVLPEQTLDQTWVAVNGNKVVKQDITNAQKTTYEKPLTDWAESVANQRLIQNGGFAQQGQSAGLGLPAGLPSPIASQNLGLAASAPPPQEAPLQSVGPAAPSGSVDMNLGVQGRAVNLGVNQNSNVINAVADRAKQLFNGKIPSQSFQQGVQAVQKNTPKINPATASQATPVPNNAPKITVPTESPAGEGTGTIQGNETHLMNVLGGAKVVISYDVTPDDRKPAASESVVKRINAIPEMATQPAVIKGLVAVESGGNPMAFNKKSGAVGLGQFTHGAAVDTGITDEDRTNPAKAVPAIGSYLQKEYRTIHTQLESTLNSQGIGTVPDPRLVLAAYNGGAKDIVNAIKAGNTSWENVINYIDRVKGPDAAKENREYAEKVINASIPFIKGGNAGDDAYIRQLQNFGILDIQPPKGVTNV